MKILSVVQGDLWGGAEAMLLELARAQASLGEPIHISLLDDGMLAQRLISDEVPVQIFPESTIGPEGLFIRLHERCKSLQSNVLGALAAQSSGLPNLGVRFAGFVNKPDAWLQRMDLLAITSDREGLPVCLLEALAVRNPVVSRGVGGIPHLLRDPRMGRLVATDRADEPATAMAAQLQDRGTAAEWVVGDLFPPGVTAEAVARGYQGMYENAAARRHTRIGSRQ
jgi:hypothetical protein